MAALKFNELAVFVRLFNLTSGYVFDLKQYEFADAFKSIGVDIFDRRYAGKGQSKAKRLLYFLEVSSKDKVAAALNELLTVWRLRNPDKQTELYLQAKDILQGLQGSSFHLLAPAADSERLWEKNQYRLFLSHSSTDKASVAKVKLGLALFGMASFVAHDDIEPTAHWQVEIEKALHSMDALVAFITEDFNKSVWCQQEIGFAFGRKVPVIPVKIDQPPAGFLGKIQAIQSRWENADFDIMKCLLKIPSFTDVFIQAVSNCEYWTHGNRFAKLLSSVQHLNLAQAQRLATAYYENSQLGQSFGFNGTKPAEYGRGLKYFLRQKGFEMKETKNGVKVVSV